MPPEKRGRQTAVFSGRAHPRPATRRRQLSERLLSACLMRKMQTPSSPGGRRTQAKAILGIIWGQDHPTHRHAHVPLRKLGPLRGFPGASLASEGLKAPFTLHTPCRELRQRHHCDIKNHTPPTLVPAAPVFQGKAKFCFKPCNRPKAALPTARFRSGGSGSRAGRGVCSHLPGRASGANSQDSSKWP